MFTGLIEEIGTIRRIQRQSDGIVLTIEAEKVLEETKIGDSIAVHGACLTVFGLEKNSFSAFASQITCETTTLGSFYKNKKVHLERALRLTSRLGGHFVQGHVDGKGTVLSLHRNPNGMELEIGIADQLRKYIVPKGSVAVDGVSLTVVAVTKKGFLLYLIPETLKNTLFDSLAVGDEVNIETDILAKYVSQMLLSMNASPDETFAEKLKKSGFM
ncbi:MAG: riboflavin synthase [Spirochaetes bacterium]|nr:riboflavin synthase [Spirochaetota bacterium]